MAQDKTIPSEETLDPEDWESIRTLGSGYFEYCLLPLYKIWSG